MDIFEETKEPLQKLWVHGDVRQKCKLVILAAIGNASELSVKVANDILDELDRTLLVEEEDATPRIDKGL